MGWPTSRKEAPVCMNSKSLYVGDPVVQKVGGPVVQAEHWNRTPDSVLFDHELSSDCKCVYAVLGGCTRQGTIATIGERLIASKLGIHRQTVRKSLAKLAERKHITIRGVGRERRIYHLHSNAFGAKQRALDAGESVKEELVSFPRPRLATVRKVG